MYDQMSISSYRKGYTVSFRDLSNDLIEEIAKDSFLIIDSKVNNFYPHFRKTFDKERIFIVESTEKNKSLPYCQKIQSVGRVKWFPETPHTGKDNVCWYLFDQRKKSDTVEFYHRGWLGGLSIVKEI